MKSILFIRRIVSEILSGTTVFKKSLLLFRGIFVNCTSLRACLIINVAVRVV